MTSQSGERSSATSPRSRRVAYHASTNDEHLGFSYEPILARTVDAVDPEDIVPSRGPQETDVWLTEWQVAEDGLDVAVDQHVEWALVPMDQSGDRRFTRETPA
jgi:hypothetical protein